MLLLALGSGRGLQYNDLDDFMVEDYEEEVVEQPGSELKSSRFGSLWPLPQKIQISQTALKITSSGFRIVDSKQSSAGPSCSLLQDAYRRYRAAFTCIPPFAICGKTRHRVAFRDLSALFETIFN